KFKASGSHGTSLPRNESPKTPLRRRSNTTSAPARGEPSSIALLVLRFLLRSPGFRRHVIENRAFAVPANDLHRPAHRLRRATGSACHCSEQLVPTSRGVRLAR